MKSITQELDYGCGVACFAFVCGVNFDRAVKLLGKEYSVKHGWKPGDLTAALNQAGFSYKNHYVRKKDVATYPIGTIVLIERSDAYPVGHYLVLSENGWMDPWINLGESRDLYSARSGFRKQLPGRAMYALVPR